MNRGNSKRSFWGNLYSTEYPAYSKHLSITHSITGKFRDLANSNQFSQADYKRKLDELLTYMVRSYIPSLVKVCDSCADELGSNERLVDAEDNQEDILEFDFNFE